jgi:hypothetical protein
MLVYGTPRHKRTHRENLLAKRERILSVLDHVPAGSARHEGYLDDLVRVEGALYLDRHLQYLREVAA